MKLQIVKDYEKLEAEVIELRAYKRLYELRMESLEERYKQAVKELNETKLLLMAKLNKK